MTARTIIIHSHFEFHSSISRANDMQLIRNTESLLIKVNYLTEPKQYRCDEYLLLSLLAAALLSHRTCVCGNDRHKVRTHFVNIIASEGRTWWAHTQNNFLMKFDVVIVFPFQWFFDRLKPNQVVSAESEREITWQFVQNIWLFTCQKYRHRTYDRYRFVLHSRCIWNERLTMAN